MHFDRLTATGRRRAENVIISLLSLLFWCRLNHWCRLCCLYRPEMSHRAQKGGRSAQATRSCDIDSGDVIDIQKPDIYIYRSVHINIKLIMIHYMRANRHHHFQLKRDMNLRRLLIPVDFLIARVILTRFAALEAADSHIHCVMWRYTVSSPP